MHEVHVLRFKMNNIFNIVPVTGKVYFKMYNVRYIEFAAVEFHSKVIEPYTKYPITIIS